MQHLGVRLETAGDYWVACWRTETGARKRKSLGNRHAVPKREAKRLCAELARKHIIHPVTREAKQAPTIKEWFAGLADTEQWKPATASRMEYVARLLIEHFGETCRLDRVKRDGAAKFRASIAAKNVTEATIRSYIRSASSGFGKAVSRDIIPINPFDREATASLAAKHWEFIGDDQFAKMLDHARDMHWRCLLGLCRWAGLRVGEALIATWGDIDWTERTIRVRSPKTEKHPGGAERTVPIEPRLHETLLTAFEAAGDGASRVCPVSHNNLYYHAGAILRRAGIEAYPKPFHTLRKSLETEWLEQYPVVDVCKWLGHSPATATKYYHQTRPESVRRVTGQQDEVAALKAEIARLNKALEQNQPN